MGKIVFELMILEGCAVRQRLQLKCNIETGWDDVVKKFAKIAHPFKIVSVRYRDTDGDMVTLSNGDDYREAVKQAASQAANEVSLAVFLDVEKTDDSEKNEVPRPSDLSQASVSTVASSVSTDSFDLASLRQEIVDSVLLELRKDRPKRSGKKKSPKPSQFCCGGCNNQLTVSGYFKCGNCKCFYLCEECERRNEHGHTDGHVFLKLRGVIKPQFANRVLLKHLILQREAVKQATITSTSTPVSNSVATSADLIHFFDSGEQTAKPCHDMSLATEMDFVSPQQQDQKTERSSSESTYESVQNNQKQEEEEEDDDFLVIPLPPCFDLDKPLFSEPLPPPKLMVQSAPVPETTSVVEEQVGETEKNLEASIQQDLDRLAVSMSNSESQQEQVVQEEQSVEPTAPPPPQPPILPLPNHGDATPYPYTPSPPSLVQQAASVFDSTPANISLTPRPPMDQLIEMGFGNRHVNAQLLEQYHGCVEHVVADLLSRENSQFQWFY